MLDQPNSDTTVTTVPPEQMVPATAPDQVAVPLHPKLNDESAALLADLLARLEKGAVGPKSQAMVQTSVQVVALSVGELRAACLANPTHELASHFAGAIRNYPAGAEVNIEQPDLQALLQNRKVILRYKLSDDGIMIRTKELV
jgi:hypothetical protein